MSTLPSWPVDENGRPMAIVIGSVKDLLPTVQFGNVTLAPTIMRPVPNGTDEELINATREVQRMAEYVCGVERRLLQWALDPSLKFSNPATGEQFAAPPAGYDPSSMPPHPADSVPQDSPPPPPAAKTS